MGTISQDHSKLDSDTVPEAITPLVETDPSIKVKSIITEVQSRFNYTISYRKILTKLFHGGSRLWFRRWLVQLSKLKHDHCTTGVRRRTVSEILHHVFWSFNPCIRAFRHCKPLVQVDGTHLYKKYKGTLLVVVAQDGNQNIVPIAFALVEGEIADAWHFFLRNLQMHIVRRDGVGMISDRHESAGCADCAYCAHCAHHADCDVCDDCPCRTERGGWTHYGDCDGYHDCST
ncbi:hypothetical protein Ahy_B01g056609 [Arachis hypogaea]|uniref:MULE transposase domain-containing protein n=1 Tax=Arachis hypogaea TaxID=3818 RepID=A0A445AZB0_ARAHY|nr:hypothetical protein Ahy_B01g056609 [Arachis hypogaea]